MFGQPANYADNYLDALVFKKVWCLIDGDIVASAIKSPQLIRIGRLVLIICDR